MPRRLKTERNCRICNSGVRMCQYHQKADMLVMQEKVYRLFREGYSREQISRKFNISVQTVKRWVRHYRRATGGLLPDDVIWDD